MTGSVTSMVIDCSITMTWCFEDEETVHSIAVLKKLANNEVLVPSIWPLEIMNVLWCAERKKRITHYQSEKFRSLLSELPIIIDRLIDENDMWHVLELARELSITPYDAAYLELALRKKAHIVTLDKALIKAAEIIGIPRI